MKTATLIGINVLDFWELTPYEFSLTVEAFNKNKEEEQEEKLTLVWLGAAWQRAKKMPRLREILNKIETPQKMTDEQMLKKVKALNSALGGETY